MTAKLLSVWCAGALVVGGMFWFGGQPSLAADEPAPAGQAMPVPNPLPATTPAADPAAAPVTAPAAPTMLPAPAGVQPTATPLQQGPAATGDGECSEFCGTPVCSPPGRYWLRADYLMWWTNGTRLPPLVTTNSQGGPGTLDDPNTTVVFGDALVGNDMRSGVRITLGQWLDDCHVWDFEFDYLSLGERSNTFDEFSNGSPILARPFFDVSSNSPGSELVAFPGVVQGRVTAEARDYFQSLGVLLSRNLCSCGACGDCDSCGCGSCDAGKEPCGGACGLPMTFGCRTDLLMGFRYYNLSSFVGVTENLTSLQQPGILPNTTFLVQDNFRARNDFYGSELGLRTQIYRGRWSLEILTKLAMGTNHQTITIDGSTAITPLGSPTQTFNTGVLAGPFNSGVYQRDSLTVIPELGLELGYQVNCHCRAYIGYDLLYWGEVARAADQIDLNADPRNFPVNGGGGGLPFPQFPGKTASFWAQGIHLGTEFRF